MQEKEIILTKICSLFHKCRLIPEKNGTYKEILRCCGLDDQYDDNRQYLEPYYYNKGYSGIFQNDNEQYNSYIGLDNIFSSLYEDNNDKAIIELLTELANNARYSIPDDADIETDDNLIRLKRLYNMCGLELVNIVDYSYSGVQDITFKVSAFSDDLGTLNDNITIEKWLKESYKEIFDSYESSFNSYTNGDFGAAIESARSTLTGIFSKFKGIPEAKWLMGLSSVAGELTGQTKEEKQKNMTTIKNDVENFNKKDISNFFGENLNGGFRKTKAIYAIYSMMSDYGTHRNEGSVEIPTAEDALMMIRMMTDIMVWIYQKQSK